MGSDLLNFIKQLGRGFIDSFKPRPKPYYIPKDIFEESRLNAINFCSKGLHNFYPINHDGEKQCLDCGYHYHDCDGKCKNHKWKCKNPKEKDLPEE